MQHERIGGASVASSRREIDSGRATASGGAYGSSPEAQHLGVTDRRAADPVEHHGDREARLGVGPGAGATQAEVPERARQHTSSGGCEVVTEAPLHLEAEHAILADPLAGP